MVHGVKGVVTIAAQSRQFWRNLRFEVQVSKLFVLGVESLNYKEPRTLNLKLQTSDSKISNLKFHQIWRLWVAISQTQISDNFEFFVLLGSSRNFVNQ